MNEQRNPYVGPRVFAYEDRGYFFGREREARDLLARVMSQRLVLFYAQSGAGKSSLINARLVPQLREAGFAVLPVGRVGGELPAGLEDVDNVYLFNLMQSVDQSQGRAGRLAHLGLTEFLQGLVSEDGLTYAYEPSVEAEVDEPSESYSAVPYVLIIDQFEELITTYPDRWPAREDFFRQLNQAMLADPDLWLVLTLREDYLAALDPFALLMRDRLRARFYMQRLSVAAACRAVTKPAAMAGRPFAAGVAEALVDDLRQVQLQHPDGTTFTDLGPYVEPVQLQVVCYRLWENLAPEKNEITESDLLAVGDVNQSLADYYADRVAAVRIESGIRERTIRDWVEKQLITASGMRGQVLMEPEESAGLPNEAIRLLQDAHLVRAEKRSGATWFELTHDRLVKPVRQNNTAWRRAKLSLLQRQATLWAEQNRPKGLLLRGAALKGAESWANDHANYLSPLDVEFLDLCRAYRAREEEALTLERAEAEARSRSAARNKRFAIALAALLLIAIIAAVIAFDQNDEALAAAATSVVNEELAVTSEAQARAAEATSKANEKLAVTSEAQARAAEATSEANEKLAVTSEAQARAAAAAQATAAVAEARASAAAAEANAAAAEARASAVAAEAQANVAAAQVTVVAAQATAEAAQVQDDAAAAKDNAATAEANAANAEATAAAAEANAAAAEANAAAAEATAAAAEAAAVQIAISSIPGSDIDLAFEEFERGYMLWRSDNRLVYVLYEDFSWEEYEENWEEERNREFPPCSRMDKSPPTPIRGFGQVWCDKLDVQSGLGDATNAEERTKWTVWEFNDHLIVRRSDSDLTYVLFNDHRWSTAGDN